jgi:D-serine deaminase-like pyridoxal phosphate-dependent protein
MTGGAIKSLSLPGINVDAYRIEGVEEILTPALAIYPSLVDANIDVTIKLLGGDADRWRPHVKTAKLASVMRRFLERGVMNFKCSTTLELVTVCEVGAQDALIAYPVVGAGARRVREIAEMFPAARISALVENPDQVNLWKGSRVSLFIDVNPGMNRTGIEQERAEEIIRLAHRITEGGLIFRGLHYYDGHLASLELPEREPVAHRGYDRLSQIVSALEKAGHRVEEVITAGTPAFPCTVSYKGFDRAPFVHRASPGTVVYGDCSSLAELPGDYGYRPAAVVVSTVVSHPASLRLTCDAGHKTVSADAGVPNCAVIGRPDLLPARPSEEHLPIDVAAGSTAPAIGEALYLVPRHVCPTVNNFDHAIMIERGRITSVERVTARGREAPLLSSDRAQ